MLSFLLSVAASTSLLGFSSGPVSVDITDWEPAAGDRLVIDTQVNEAYLIHENGDYLRFSVATGQRRQINYIGRSYFAATPAGDWTLCRSEKKAPSAFFGPTGRFFRLCDEDGEETAYGLHGYRYMDALLAKTGDKRFISYGCVLVPEEYLDVIELMLSGNGNIPVETQYGGSLQAVTEGSQL